MRIIKPLVIVEDDLSMVMPNGLTMAQHMLKKIEHFTRKCYKSEGKMTEDSYKEFVPRIYNTRKHEGIIEHRLISVTFITDRGVSHEGVRHRMAAYLQESTRYVDYAGKGITFILPPWMEPDHRDWDDFVWHCRRSGAVYQMHRETPYKWSPEQARYWLPQGIKTEYAASKNLGSWMNFLRKRTAPNAHPQMRQLAIPLLAYFQYHMPEIFGSLKVPEFDGDLAKLVVNPFYEQVEFEEVYKHD